MTWHICSTITFAELSNQSSRHCFWNKKKNKSKNKIHLRRTLSISFLWTFVRPVLQLAGSGEVCEDVFAITQQDFNGINGYDNNWTLFTLSDTWSLSPDSCFLSRWVQVKHPWGLWHRHGRPWDREGGCHHPVTVQEVPEEEARWEVIVSRQTAARGEGGSAATVWHLHVNKFIPAGSAGAVMGWMGMQSAC